MVRSTPVIIAALLFGMLPVPATAEVMGIIGPQSRGTVRISVSVAPRVSINPASTAREREEAAAGPLQLGSNVPGLRLTLVPAEPPSSAEPQSAPATAAQLLLVVPD